MSKNKDHTEGVPTQMLAPQPPCEHCDGTGVDPALGPAGELLLCSKCATPSALARATSA